MSKKSILLGLTTLVIGGALLIPQALAYQGDPNVKGPNCSEERHEAIEKAFETKNYEAWKNLMKDRGRITQVITKDNFAKFAEAHELAEQGKMDEAAKIRQELNLGLRNGTGPGMGMGRWNR
jgi:hypothetical protein